VLPVLDRFEDAVTVVTGGASGIGRAIALDAAARGSHVAVADIHEERLEAAVEELRATGVEAIGVRCDVTSDGDVEALRDAVLDRFGHVDLLCNNAGVAVLGPPERVPVADWEWILQVNVLGLVRGVQAFVPSMLERGRGHVVNTASVAGTWAYTWDAAPYITSKFAAYGFSEALARRLHPMGLGVSVLCPGLVLTNLGETARFAGVPEEQRADWSYFPPEMQQPVDAAAVGRMVTDAVLSGRFAIFTHPEDEERFGSWRLDIDRSLADAVEGAPAPPVLPAP
jgi:NAD(P)-dependent dehydrogenase (short-subunit alcohol dehydrogenase family)